MKFAGIFQGDPDFLEIIKEMRAEREDKGEIIDNGNLYIYKY